MRGPHARAGSSSSPTSPPTQPHPPNQ
jgi:hypothetical protein